MFVFCTGIANPILDRSEALAASVFPFGPRRDVRTRSRESKREVVRRTFTTWREAAWVSLRSRDRPRQGAISLLVPHSDPVRRCVT